MRRASFLRRLKSASYDNYDVKGHVRAWRYVTRKVSFVTSRGSPVGVWMREEPDVPRMAAPGYSSRAVIRMSRGRAAVGDMAAPRRCAGVLGANARGR